MNIEIDKKYKYIGEKLRMFNYNGDKISDEPLKRNEIITLKEDCYFEDEYLFMRDNGDISIAISKEYLDTLIEEI